MNPIYPSIAEQIIYTIIISNSIILGMSLITGFMNEIIPGIGTESGIIKYWKMDAKKFRLIPKIVFFYFIYLIEYSYKFGIFSGKCLKFIFIKENK